MNWYKFKIELLAWLYKTGACVLTTAVVLRVWFEPEGGIRYYPLHLRFLAENEWIIRTGLVLGVIMLWLCYWRIFKICRKRSTYRTAAQQS